MFGTFGSLSVVYFYQEGAHRYRERETVIKVGRVSRRYVRAKSRRLRGTRYWSASLSGRLLGSATRCLNLISMYLAETNTAAAELYMKTRKRSLRSSNNSNNATCFKTTAQRHSCLCRQVVFRSSFFFSCNLSLKKNYSSPLAD